MIENKILYIGVDANEKCIAAAKSKINNDYFHFTNTDIREAKSEYIDLVYSFAFLKHFGLHEWPDIFKKVSSLGEFADGVFYTCPMLDGFLSS